MKFGTSLALALVMGVLSLSGLSTGVYASQVNSQGNMCKNYDAADATFIDYFVYGTRNLATVDKAVICPIVRVPTVLLSAAYSITVVFDGVDSSGQSHPCTLYSYDTDGTFLGSQGFLLGGSSIPTSVNATLWSTASVLCI